MNAPWKDIRKRAKKEHGFLNPRDAVQILSDADALLAVVKVTQMSLGMSVPELLMNVAKRIQSGDGDVELSDILAMWLRRLADEIKKTLDALPEHLKG